MRPKSLALILLAVAGCVAPGAAEAQAALYGNRSRRLEIAEIGWPEQEIKKCLRRAEHLLISQVAADNGEAPAAVLRFDAETGVDLGP